MRSGCVGSQKASGFGWWETASWAALNLWHSPLCVTPEVAREATIRSDDSVRVRFGLRRRIRVYSPGFRLGGRNDTA